MLFIALIDAALAAEPAATPPAAESAAAPAPPAPSADPEAARLQEYKERVVLFEDWVGVSASTGAVVSTWTVPKKGIYGEPLNGRAFYDYVGRTDLGDIYARRHATSLGLRIGGLAMLAGGLALGLTNIQTDCEFVGTAIYPQADSAAEARSMCRDENAAKAPLETGGYVIAGLGFVGVGVGFYFPVHPAESHERKKMAASFNAALATELGVDPNAK